MPFDVLALPSLKNTQAEACGYDSRAPFLRPAARLSLARFCPGYPALLAGSRQGLALLPPFVGRSTRACGKDFLDVLDVDEFHRLEDLLGDVDRGPSCWAGG